MVMNSKNLSFTKKGTSKSISNYPYEVDNKNVWGESTHQARKQFKLLNEAVEYADSVEKKSGKVPIIYKSTVERGEKQNGNE